MNALKDFARLLRVQQWYKSSIVFIALLFSGNLFSLPLVFTSLVAFLSLSLVSSANYIINDLKDLAKDRKHPLKKDRPLASGRISVTFAKTTIVILLLFGLLIAYVLNLYFLATLVLLFLLMQVYTFYLKKYLYFDILLIAMFFVLRAVLGALALLVWVSPWLIICPFFLALFLAAMKRHADLLLLGESSYETRNVLKQYSVKQTNRVTLVSAFFLVGSFAWYALQNNVLLALTLPFACFALYRYKQLVDSDPLIGLQTQKAVRDWKLTSLLLIWFSLLLFLLYWI